MTRAGQLHCSTLADGTPDCIRDVRNLAIGRKWDNPFAAQKHGLKEVLNALSGENENPALVGR